MRILVTGGAGFIGFNLLCYLQDLYPSYRFVALDNLKRAGSETNMSELNKRGIDFILADIRYPQEIKKAGSIDLILHCASDTSVLSGITSSSEILIQNNLLGSINVFEYAACTGGQLIFFSTNRVYGCKELNEIKYSVGETRFLLSADQYFPGISFDGVSEAFPVTSNKTFYGATKYCSELLLQEYASYRNLNYLINRFGVVSGKGQFGMQDQGVMSYWMKQHLTNGRLSYFGYGGEGKQVRDALHIMDLCRLIELQIKELPSLQGETFNIGGGFSNSFSLQELTQYCESITGRSVVVEGNTQSRLGDIPIYYTDNSKIKNRLNWSPKHSVLDILNDLYHWHTFSQESKAVIENIR